MAILVSEKPKDEQEHDANPFREEYSCNCGNLTGRKNNDVFCWKCMKFCTKRPPRWRNYKGFINDRTNGTRELNPKEQAFYDLFFETVSRNHETVRNFNASSFLTRNLKEIVSCAITRCRYLNDRILHPEMYELNVSEIYNVVYDFIEYMFDSVYHEPYPYAEQARDTLYKDSEEYLIQEIANILSYNLITAYI